MHYPAITVAVTPNDRSDALLDGRATIEGVQAQVLRLPMQELFPRLLQGPAFDVTELSFSAYVASHSRGDSPYIALPVFPSRAFRHGAIHVRKDRIRRPQDLVGARIGVPDYAMTPAVWVRAFLLDDYGVRPEDVRWIQAGLAGAAGRRLTAASTAHLQIQSAPAASLWQLLAQGEIDAVIDAHPPPAATRPQLSFVGPLFDDTLAESREYFQRTRVFPILHVLAIRKTLAQEHPWLAQSVVRAFRHSKSLAQERLLDTSVAAVMLPLLSEHLAAIRTWMGEDFWADGVRGARATLEAFVHHHHTQGLSPRELKVQELFHPTTVDD